MQRLSSRQAVSGQSPPRREKRTVRNFEAQQPAPEPTDRHAGDRFVNRGQDLICEAALAALQQHSSLPPREPENFAAKFASGTGKLAARQE